MFKSCDTMIFDINNQKDLIEFKEKAPPFSFCTQLKKVHLDPYSAKCDTKKVVLSEDDKICFKSDTVIAEQEGEGNLAIELLVRAINRLNK